MINNNWKQVVQKQEVRQNLSKIRQELKKTGDPEQFTRLIAGEEHILIELLESEDAKTRKNAALLMGDLGKQEFLAPVFQAYQNETQRFVRSSYLTAISHFDYREYMENIKDSLDALEKSEVTEENQKHLTEEMRELSSLIVRMEGVAKRKFIGWDETYDVVLLTNRNFTAFTRDELVEWEPGAETKLFNAGVMARVGNLRWVDKIRTYQELLFAVKGMKSCPMDAVKAAEVITKSSLLEFLSKSHDGGAPYYFRVEMKSKRGRDEKSAFVKKLSGQIERLSNRKLINSTDHYEIEIRLVENKEGNCNLLVKLFTLQDKRFSYRQEVMPTSIKTANAALTVALAKEYMKEDAQVLDPFCGVGTMLAERQKALKVHTAYGVDIQEDAIVKAKKNTETAKQIVHYVNRDFFRFQHDYLFDEVITNMPFQIGKVSSDEVYKIYKLFFRKLSEHLKDEALVILYSHDKEIVNTLADSNGFSLLEEYEISMREGTYVFLLRYIG